MDSLGKLRLHRGIIVLAGSAKEAAEATFGETTTWPEDHARCAFRLLRHAPRPSVAIAAVSSL